MVRAPILCSLLTLTLMVVAAEPAQACRCRHRRCYSPCIPCDAGQTARVKVQLPAEAKLYWNDQPTVSTGATRNFVTPPLESGQEYVYVARAEGMRDGQAITATRRVTVRAGAEEQIDFGDLSKTEDEGDRTLPTISEVPPETPELVIPDAVKNLK